MNVTHPRLYLERGISVLPLRPNDKKPYGRWRRWMKERMDAERAGIWWGGGVRPLPNLGIVTGDISGNLVVLDIEPEHKEFVQDEVELPDTPKVHTARGGLHVYCRGDLRCGRLWLGDKHVGDIRGTGGYVVAPPSTTPAGAYKWCSYHGDDWTLDDLAPVPDWVSDRTRTEGGGRAHGSSGAEGGASQRGSHPSVRVRSDTLMSWMPSSMQRAISQGWYPGGAWGSPSELDFAVMLECAHLGVDYASAFDLFAAEPFGTRAGMHLQRDEAYLERTYDRAYESAFVAARGAVQLRCLRVVTAQGRISNGALLRALVEFTQADDPQTYRYELPIVLGPPRTDELSGEWLQLLMAFGVDAEPTPEPALLVGRGTVAAIVRESRVRRFVLPEVFGGV